MTADIKELRSRWSRVRQIMIAKDLDAVIAVGLSRDEILLGQQRWLTGFIARGGPAIAIVFRDHVEIFYGRWSALVREFYADGFGAEVKLTDGIAPEIVAGRLKAMHVKRLGIAETESYSFAMASEIARQCPGIAQEDISSDFLRLRLIKSAHEVALIRKSAAIADKIIAQMKEICRIGRPIYQAVADIDRLTKLEGAESGFNVIMPVPFVGSPISSLIMHEPFERNRRYAIEVSPRLDGYYSQLTVPVTSVPDDREFSRAYDELIAAKKMAQSLMKPGANMTDVGKAVEKFLVERGLSMPGPSLGHFCGMALEEPRHMMSAPFILEENMTMIFHPDCGGKPFERFIRADTYLITKDGAENLNHHAGGLETII